MKDIGTEVSMSNLSEHLWIRLASQHKIRTGSGSDRPNAQIPFEDFLMPVSIFLSNPWPVAAAPGSDFVTNRRFQSNCIVTRPFAAVTFGALRVWMLRTIQSW